MDPTLVDVAPSVLFAESAIMSATTVEHRPAAVPPGASSGNIERVGDAHAEAESEPVAVVLPRSLSATSVPRADNAAASAVGFGDPDLPKAVVPAEIAAHPVIDGFVDQYRRKGVLIPLKTTLELRQDHTLVQAYITRAPTKAANSIAK